MIKIDKNLILTDCNDNIAIADIEQIKPKIDKYIFL